MAKIAGVLCDANMHGSDCTPCQGHITHSGKKHFETVHCYPMGKGTLAASCCGGIKSLKSAAKKTTARRTACGCLKLLVGSVKNLKPGLVSDVPYKCGLDVGYPISICTNCSKCNEIFLHDFRRAGSKLLVLDHDKQ